MGNVLSMTTGYTMHADIWIRSRKQKGLDVLGSYAVLHVVCVVASAQVSYDCALVLYYAEEKPQMIGFDEIIVR